MSKIKDNKDWVYSGGIVGTMRCAECHKVVERNFRYYSTEHAYVIQCYDCGHEQPSWAKRLAEVKERQRVQDLEDRRTDILTLCDRIKAAYLEGFNYSNYEGYSETDAWDESEAKRIYDILRKQAMEQ